jgi:hypothetical protein
MELLVRYNEPRRPGNFPVVIAQNKAPGGLTIFSGTVLWSLLLTKNVCSA